MSDNVIQFNKFKKEEIESLSESIEYADDAITEFGISIAREVFSIMEEEGYDVAKPEMAYEMILLVETIKAMIYVSNGESYPIHELARSLFPIEDMKELMKDFYDES